MIRKYGYALCLALIFFLVAACGGNGVSTVSNNSNNTEADTGITDDTSTTDDDTSQTDSDVAPGTDTDTSTTPDKCAMIDCIEHSTCDSATGLCGCDNGYDMGADADGVAKCVDQCAMMRCGANTIGCEAGACICAEGYETDGVLGCKKIADGACTDLPGACQDHATCNSESGKCVCKEGYSEGTHDNGAATCIDKCVTMRCGVNTYCEAGQCLCAEGYEKDRTGQCAPVKSEVCGNNVCPEYSRCENDTCICNFGEKDGLGGVDDQRLTCKTPCDAIRCNLNMTCDPVVQNCVCDAGYVMVEGLGCQKV